MKSGSTPVDRLRQALSDADAVVIGAGAGLSTAAGFAYSGERFARYFSDFEKKYGFHDMYSRRVLPLRFAGSALGLLEPLYLDQPLSECAQAGI